MNKTNDIRKAIDTEKEFLSDNPVIGGDDSLKIDRWIYYMTLEIEQAESAANFQQDPDALHHIMRVAAMAEMCLEENHPDGVKFVHPMHPITIDDVNLAMNGASLQEENHPPVPPSKGEKKKADSAATEPALCKDKAPAGKNSTMNQTNQ